MKFSHLVLQDARAIADNITLVGSGLLNTTDLFVSSLQGVITSLGSLSSECTLSGVISLCIGVVNPVRSLATAASDGIPDVSLYFNGSTRNNTTYIRETVRNLVHSTYFKGMYMSQHDKLDIQLCKVNK